VKAHRTDLISFAFGLLFLALSAWWLLAQLLGLVLPPVGWFLAGALILIGVFGLVGALRSGQSGRPTPDDAAPTTVGAEPGTPTSGAPISGAPTLTFGSTSTWDAPPSSPTPEAPTWEASPSRPTPETPTWGAPPPRPTPEAPTAELRTPPTSTPEPPTADVIHPAWLAHPPAEPEPPTETAGPSTEAVPPTETAGPPVSGPPGATAGAGAGADEPTRGDLRAGQPDVDTAAEREGRQPKS